ncbi:unnamed protein product, partial [Didymodactylos carnosus]
SSSTTSDPMKSFFAQFIQQINKWFDWFDRFIDIFQHIIDWLKMHNVNRSNQLLIGSLRTRDDPKMTLIEMRIIILCQLFNCLIPFQILNPGTLNIQENTMKFLTELKRFQPNNRLTVEDKKIHEQNISIIHRQQVQWSLASENHACEITVEYRSHGANDRYKTSFQKQNVPIHKNVLHGQFETEETTVLDNALITMEHLFKSGTVDIHLRRLTTQQSNFEIGYSIDRIQVGMKKVRDENDQSQQGFNQWAQQTIENIYHIFTQLELSGHPYYQLRDEHYEIHLQQTDSMLTDLRSYQNARIENAIQTRIQSLELIYNTLKTTYDIWIQNLKKYRHECSLLKLFSNRKIMILIILFRISNAQNPIRNRLLKKLFEFKDLDNKNEEEQKINYLLS